MAGKSLTLKNEIRITKGLSSAESSQTKTPLLSAQQATKKGSPSHAYLRVNGFPASPSIFIILRRFSLKQRAALDPRFASAVPPGHYIRIPVRQC